MRIIQASSSASVSFLSLKAEASLKLEVISLGAQPIGDFPQPEG